MIRDVYNGEEITWDPNLWPGPTDRNFSCTMVGELPSPFFGPFVQVSIIALNRQVRGEEYLSWESCDSVLPCGVCRFERGKKLVLKGLCVDEGGDFDDTYYAHGLVNGKTHFK